MTFISAIILFVLLIAAGIFGFHFLTKKDMKQPAESIDSLEDLLQTRKKGNNYKAAIFFFSTFISLLFISWVFDAGYSRLGEKKQYAKVIEEVDSILTFTAKPPPPPKQPEVKPEEIIQEVVEIPEIKIVDKIDTVKPKPVVKTPLPPPPGTPGLPEPPAPTQTVDNKIYYPSELTDLPDYPGGKGPKDDYMQKKLFNLKAPAKYRLNNKPCRVTVYFVVEKDGTLSNVKLSKRFQVELDKATQAKIINAIKTMPKWSPGKVGVQPKKVQVSQVVVL